MFDAHAHLPESSDFSLPADYSACVCATCEADFPLLEKLHAENAKLVPAFGIHPWFLKTRSENWEQNLRAACRRNPIAQVGEIGLDTCRRGVPAIAEQCEIFEAQLALAAELRRRAVVHCVGAWGKMMEILRRRHASGTLGETLFHGFSGSPEIARELLALGADFSFSARQLETPSRKLANVLALLPPTRVFSESDAPLGRENPLWIRVAAKDRDKRHA